jgi:hypothetical protein
MCNTDESPFRHDMPALTTADVQGLNSVLVKTAGYEN